MRSGLARVLVGLASLLIASAAPAPDIVTVHLSNFAFTPDQLRLRVGEPVHLRIVNDSTGGHNFTAPSLFSASTFPDGSPPTSGKVEVGPKSSTDIVFVPRVPGTYRVECTHFLHSLFGMTGNVVVEVPPR
jgi:plastocyanin